MYIPVCNISIQLLLVVGPSALSTFGSPRHTRTPDDMLCRKSLCSPVFIPTIFGLARLHHTIENTPISATLRYMQLYIMHKFHVRDAVSFRNTPKSCMRYLYRHTSSSQPSHSPWLCLEANLFVEGARLRGGLLAGLASQSSLPCI